MKSFHTFLITAILFFIAPTSLYAGHCGNDHPDGTSFRPPCWPKCGTNLFTPYTGNVHREIWDLQIWGGVGDMPLIWKRYYNSRDGWGIWNHAFDYFMSDRGVNSQGQAMMNITFPEGGDNFFTQSTADPNLWLPVAGVDKRLFQDGDNFFLQRADGYRYRFEKLNARWGIIYQLQDFRDPFQNLYKLTYDNDHRLKRVTDLPGGFLRLVTHT